MMTLKEYSKVKQDVIMEIDDIRKKIKKLFNGSFFDRTIYDGFSSEKKRMFSTLKEMETNLLGQLDVFKAFEGQGYTTYERISDRYSELEAQEKRRVTL